MSTNHRNQTVGEEACRIIEKLGEAQVKKLLRRVVRNVQKYGRDTMSSSDDSGLINLWDEFCIHIQHEEGFGFNLVENLIYDICKNVLDELQNKDKHAYESVDLFLNTTYQGLLAEEEMIYDNTAYILYEKVKSLANIYSNKRITNYIYR